MPRPPGGTALLHLSIGPHVACEGGRLRLPAARPEEGASARIAARIATPARHFVPAPGRFMPESSSLVNHGWYGAPRERMRWVPEDRALPSRASHTKFARLLRGVIPSLRGICS
jgi:hypothetical protein